MKNAGRLLFILICLTLCIIPFAGMLTHATDTTTENKRMAEFPAIKENGKWNITFMQELGAYFEDHFAFRPALVSADAEIQSKAFKVSNVDTVIVGNEGWLYYTSTADDYLGRNTLSERGVANIAHNLSLVQQYVQEKGAKFLFTVAPNKNSLYGENMPYYFQKKAGNKKNIHLLETEIEKRDIAYADLFSLFQNQDEVLYLKRDSHWNNKGAMLAYHTLLEELDIPHDNYETAKVLRTKEEYGDLNKMLYPLTAKAEWNYDYQNGDSFTYQTDTASVEDAWIETKSEKNNGSLLMFRDSFGNTLLPFMANAFSEAYFSKGVPQNITDYMESYHPDTVILEKVERNISELATDPPLMEGLPIDLGQKIETVPSDTTLEITESETNTSYWEISGVLEDSLCTEDVQTYVRVTDGTVQNTYHAFSVTTPESDYGFKLYLPKEKVPGNSATFDIIVEKDGVFQIIKSESQK